MRSTLCSLVAVALLPSIVIGQTPPPVGDPNEIWLDVTYVGKQPGEIKRGVDFSLDFYIANEEELGGSTNGFRMWSPDGVTWGYRTDPSWYGSSPASRGVTDPHVSISGRWIGAYDGGITPLLVPNPLLGGSVGPSEDSIMIGGAAVFEPGLPAGPLQNLVQLNMTMGNNEGTWCVDSVTLFPPHGDWLFAPTSGSEAIPSFAGPFCWTVPANLPPEVADIPDQTIMGGGTFNPINLDDYVTDPDHADSQITWMATDQFELIVDITDRVATVSRPDAFWYGSEIITFTATDPASGSDSDPVQFTVTVCCWLPGDINEDFAMNISDAVFVIDNVFKGGPLPNCCITADTNGDGFYNISDGVLIINHVFKGGPAPVCGHAENGPCP